MSDYGAPIEYWEMEKYMSEHKENEYKEVERSNWDQQAKAGFIGTFCTRDPLALAVVLAKSKMIPPETRRTKEIWVGFIIINPPANPSGVFMCVWDAKGDEITGKREWDLMRRVNEVG